MEFWSRFRQGMSLFGTATRLVFNNPILIVFWYVSLLLPIAAFFLLKFALEALPGTLIMPHQFFTLGTLGSLPGALLSSGTFFKLLVMLFFWLVCYLFILVFMTTYSALVGDANKERELAAVATLKVMMSRIISFPWLILFLLAVGVFHLTTMVPFILPVLAVERLTLPKLFGRSVEYCLTMIPEFLGASAYFSMLGIGLSLLVVVIGRSIVGLFVDSPLGPVVNICLVATTALLVTTMLQIYVAVLPLLYTEFKERPS